LPLGFLFLEQIVTVVILMRVKRLEIQGFKSFKDRTIIHFDHSITGIVGPNGCGKSNIVDAFFWVMGEQSYKHMRGNSSDDLIFNGSSKYSPSGMAEATMVLETDVIDPLAEAPAGASVHDTPIHLKTKEISVTRRLYRSGEGEYLVNGTIARLKDIHELFMDTGVGAKGYSVIEQGQIGKIVNAKPEERRLLIEEAAGIAKYKARKKESLRKMEATQANLSRLTDIIQEIEKSLASLDRQAQKARQYKKYKDELLDKEMTWGRRKSKILTEKLETLRRQRDQLEHELAALKAQLQTAENSIEVDRVDLVDESKEAEILQARIQELSSDLSGEKSALDLSRRRQGDLNSQLESLETEQEELEHSIQNDTQKLIDQETQAQQADEFFQKAAKEAQEIHQVLSLLRRDVELARAQLDSQQKQLLTGIHQSSDLSSRAAGLSSKAESARAQTERLSQQIESQNERVIELQEELDTLRESSEKLLSEKTQLQIEKKEQAAHLQGEEQRIRQLEREKEQALFHLTQLKSKLQSLEELDQAHEGLADGPKAALDWAKSKGKGDQLSALTDLLTVSSEYEGVLESWLEKKIESLVVENSELALPLLEQILKERQGRVSIQLVSQLLGPTQKNLKASQEIQTLLESHGFHVRALLSDQVQIDPSYKGVIEPLLNRVFIVESSEPMIPFFHSENFKCLEGWSLASLDGVILESSGSLRAGNLDASGATGILRRKRSIEELKTQVISSEDEFHQAEDALFQAKQDLEIQRARLQTLQADLQALEVQSAGIQRDVHQTERALQEARTHLESWIRDSDQLSSESERASQEKEELESRIQELISLRTELEVSISDESKVLEEKELALEERESELQALRVNEASLRERAVSLKRELEATRSLKSDRERRLSEVRRTLEKASREQEEFSGGESDLAQRIEELTYELASQKERLSAVKDKMEQANSKVNSTLELIKTLHKQGEKTTAESNQLALEIEKHTAEFTHLIQNLEEKYGPGCLSRPTQASVQAESHSSNEPTTQDESSSNPNSEDEGLSKNQLLEEDSLEMTPEQELALGEEVERLRERIRRLGEVNVMAIEEYEELKKRYDHLQGEKQDLERSLDNLQNAIEHINKTSEERFRKAFEAIASRFERLFPIIFGGGSAKLSLVYPEGSNDILEAGVDILAQPPGKKVANITLLSGGEKALTAVSLIFAIFMVKPSPFCVLDEVDAPLDDANIGKFNALLREMSVKSQFILITHNKKTMELNDTLYGVTMEEPGVSKMVSIELQ